jgi:hypothetical protein
MLPFGCAWSQQAPNPPACNSYVIQQVINEHPEDLKFKQHMCIFAGKLFSGEAVFGSAFFAGIAQAQNDPGQWGQGSLGYFRRVGSRYAQGVAKTTGESVFAYLLREDPRYEPSEDRGCWRRAGHAFASIFVVNHLSAARTETGKPRRRKWLAISKMVGAASSGVVGLTWYPARQNTPGDVLSRTGQAYGGYLASAVFQEFQADLFRALGKLVGSDRPSYAGTNSSPGRR